MGLLHGGNRCPDLLGHCRWEAEDAPVFSFLYLFSMFVTMCHHAFLLEHLVPVLDMCAPMPVVGFAK
jgi:hypothetical protein